MEWEGRGRGALAPTEIMPRNPERNNISRHPKQTPWELRQRNPGGGETPLGDSFWARQVQYQSLSSKNPFSLGETDICILEMSYNSKVPPGDWLPCFQGVNVNWAWPEFEPLYRVRPLTHQAQRLESGPTKVSGRAGPFPGRAWKPSHGATAFLYREY